MRVIYNDMIFCVITTATCKEYQCGIDYVMCSVRQFYVIDYDDETNICAKDYSLVLEDT